MRNGRRWGIIFINALKEQHIRLLLHKTIWRYIVKEHATHGQGEPRDVRFSMQCNCRYALSAQPFLREDMSMALFLHILEGVSRRQDYHLLREPITRPDTRKKSWKVELFLSIYLEFFMLLKFLSCSSPHGRPTAPGVGSPCPPGLPSEHLDVTCFSRRCAILITSKTWTIHEIYAAFKDTRRHWLKIFFGITNLENNLPLPKVLLLKTAQASSPSSALQAGLSDAVKENDRRLHHECYIKN